MSLHRSLPRWVVLGTVAVLVLGFVGSTGGPAGGAPMPPQTIHLGPVGVVAGNYIGTNLTSLNTSPQNAIIAVYNGDANLLKQKQVTVNPGQTVTVGFLTQVYRDLRARITVPGGTSQFWLADLQVRGSSQGSVSLIVTPPFPGLMAASPIGHVTPEGALRAHVANLGTVDASFDASEYDAAGNLVAQMAISNVAPGAIGTASFAGGVTADRRIVVTGPGGGALPVSILASTEYFLVASAKSTYQLSDLLVSS